MKNLNLFYLAFIGLLLTACSAGKKIPLQLNLAKNSQFNYETLNETEITVTAMGQKQQTLNSQALNMTYKVLDKKANGDTKLETTIKEAVVTQNLPGVAIVFDSKNPKNNTPPEVAGMFQPMVGHVTTSSFSQSGQLLAVEGNDELMDKMAAKMATQGMTAAQAKGLLRMQFGDDAITNMLSSVTKIYPDTPVKVGDSWTKIDTITTTMSLITNSNYTLTKRKSGKSFITISGTLKSNPDAAPTAMMGMKLQYKIAGTLTGNIVLDEATGWADSSEITQDAKGTMLMSGEMIPAITADMEMHTRTASKKL